MARDKNYECENGHGHCIFIRPLIVGAILQGSATLGPALYWACQVVWSVGRKISQAGDYLAPISGARAQAWGGVFLRSAFNPDDFAPGVLSPRRLDTSPCHPEGGVSSRPLLKLARVSLPL